MAEMLPSRTSQAIFDTEIVPAEFNGISKSPSKPPLAILVLGQTGAGKSILVPTILEQMTSRDRKPAHFIADTYKIYHPLYKDLIAHKPNLASPTTSPDARKWLHMAAEEAVRREVDVILESACRHAKDFSELAEVFHRGGYRIEVIILAVPAGLSLLGTVVRFYQKLPEAGSRGLPSRLTPTNVHNESYNGLLDAARYLDGSGIADQVLVVRRGLLVAYGEEKIDESNTRSSVAATLTTERHKPLNLLEKDLALRDLAALESLGMASLSLPKLRELLYPLLRFSDSPDEDLSPLSFVDEDREEEKRRHVLRLGHPNKNG